MDRLSEPQARAVAHFLATGDTDPNARFWPGQNFLEAATNANCILRDALVAAVLERVPPADQKDTPSFDDLVTLTRAKVEPMVNGLFPATERAAVLDALQHSVVFLTPEKVVELLRSSPYLSTSWKLAGMYLLERGAEPLFDDAPSIVGMSEETTCYLTLDYFPSLEREPFSDYLVHEAAHVFHNCKRGTIGLTETRSKDFLLGIDYQKRETFAYACETYSRILASASTLQGRRDALAAYSAGPLPSDRSVDIGEYLDILSVAIGARNGWKRILQACAPSP